MTALLEFPKDWQRALIIVDHPDGRILEGLALRRDLAREIRRVRPDVVLTLNHRDEWGT